MHYKKLIATQLQLDATHNLATLAGHNHKTAINMSELQAEIAARRSVRAINGVLRREVKAEQVAGREAESSAHRQRLKSI